MCELGEKSPNETARKTASASAASTRSVFLSVLPVIMLVPQLSRFLQYNTQMHTICTLYRPCRAEIYWSIL